MCRGWKSLGEERPTTNFQREPCAGYREVPGEASVAACAGRIIEPRNRHHRVRRDCLKGRRRHPPTDMGEVKWSTPGSGNHGTYRSMLSGSEISSGRPASMRGREVKEGNPWTEMNDPKKSDSAMVVMKRANEGHHRPAELAERRAGAEGKPGGRSRCRTPRRESLSREADRIRQAVAACRRTRGRSRMRWRARPSVWGDRSNPVPYH